MRNDNALQYIVEKAQKQSVLNKYMHPPYSNLKKLLSAMCSEYLFCKHPPSYAGTACDNAFRFSSLP